MKKIYTTLLIVLLVVSANATDYYVSTSGSNTNSGTSIDSPLATLTSAISKLSSAGDNIYILEGEYQYSSKISLSKNGTAEAPYSIQAYNNQKVIIDFSNMALSSSNRGFSLSGNYWIVKGLIIRRAGDNGMAISGNYNVIENCVFYENQDTGLQLSNGASNNKIINCDSYGNADPTDYGDADGFACKMDVGDNNYFYGCRSWLNVDDGWDGYMRGANDVNTVLENCWTWMNGYFIDGSDGGASANGNGFKVGGSDDKTLMHNFTLINCVAFDNKSKGFDQNNNKGDMYFYNGTSFRNVGKNYSIPSTLNSGKVAEVINCISIDGSNNLGSFVTQQTNSWDGFSLTDDDFVSLDTTGVSGARQADGSLPDIDVFKLVEGSDLIDGGTDLGYDYNGDAPDLGAFESEYSSTGIFDLDESLDYDLKIYGNPVESTLRLSYYVGDKPIEVILTIVATNGQVLKQAVQPVQTSRCYAELNVSDLSQGTYVLLVQSKMGIQSALFMKK